MHTHKHLHIYTYANMYTHACKFTHMHVCVYVCHVCAGVWSKKRVRDPLELELTGSFQLPNMGTWWELNTVGLKEQPVCLVLSYLSSLQSSTFVSSLTPLACYLGDCKSAQVDCEDEPSQLRSVFTSPLPPWSESPLPLSFLDVSAFGSQASCL
jgi:hypothetical protein